MMRLKMKTLRKSVACELKDYYPEGVDMEFVDGPVDLSEEPSHSPFKGWWKALDDRSKYDELEMSLDRILDALRERPVDAIVGFSQGAALAVMVAAILENTPARSAAMAKQGYPLSFPDLPQQPLKFVIAYSGFKGSPKYYNGFYKPRISTPILHVSAKLDHMITPEESTRLVKSCREAEVYVHPGGHWVPTDPKMVSLVSGFINRTVRRTMAEISACNPV
jgi:predicted esterase